MESVWWVTPVNTLVTTPLTLPRLPLLLLKEPGPLTFADRSDSKQDELYTQRLYDVWKFRNLDVPSVRYSELCYLTIVDEAARSVLRNAIEISDGICSLSVFHIEADDLYVQCRPFRVRSFNAIHFALLNILILCEFCYKFDNVAFCFICVAWHSVVDLFSCGCQHRIINVVVIQPRIFVFIVFFSTVDDRWIVAFTCKGRVLFMYWGGLLITAMVLWMVSTSNMTNHPMESPKCYEMSTDSV